MRKQIKTPEYSPALAELVGVILGDGTISRYQLAVAFNKHTERELASRVQHDVLELFGMSASLRPIPRNALVVVASSRNLVEYLEKVGLRVGDKIRNGSTVPPWIFEKDDLKRACLRGLIDTDGSIYVHQHNVSGRPYRNIEISFTSHSALLLQSTQRLFAELGFRSRVSPRYNHVFLHRGDDVNRYMADVGTRNPHHLQRAESFWSSQFV